MTAATQPQPADSDAPPPSPPLPIDGPNISNMVCGVNLNCLIDLKTLALHARNAELKSRFQAVILRIFEPRTTALIFTSGKMQVLGSRSVADAKLAARKFARIVQKTGFNVRMNEFNVQNIVANADMRCQIRLEGLAVAHRQFTHFEPELFPGLIYRIHQPDLKLTMLIFAKGKVVLLGAKKERQVHQALKLIYPVIKQFPVAT